jgi:hypothetical protein
VRIPKPKRVSRERKPIARGKAPNKKRKTSRAAQGRKADALFSLIVRNPQVCTYHLDAERGEFEPLMSHGGCIQCAHKVTRGRRTVRWDEENAMPLCSGAHVWFTHNPDEWTAYLEWKYGKEAVEALKVRSAQKWDGDIEGVLVRLAARAVALGIEAK